MNTKIKAYYTIVGDMLSLAPQCKEIANAVVAQKNATIADWKKLISDIAGRVDGNVATWFKSLAGLINRDIDPEDILSSVERFLSENQCRYQGGKLNIAVLMNNFSTDILENVIGSSCHTLGAEDAATPSEEAKSVDTNVYYELKRVERALAAALNEVPSSGNKSDMHRVTELLNMAMDRAVGKQTMLLFAEVISCPTAPVDLYAKVADMIPDAMNAEASGYGFTMLQDMKKKVTSVVAIPDNEFECLCSFVEKLESGVNITAEDSSIIEQVHARHDTLTPAELMPCMGRLLKAQCERQCDVAFGAKIYHLINAHGIRKVMSVFMDNNLYSQIFVRGNFVPLYSTYNVDDIESWFLGSKEPKTARECYMDMAKILYPNTDIENTLSEDVNTARLCVIDGFMLQMNNIADKETALTIVDYLSCPNVNTTTLTEIADSIKDIYSSQNFGVLRDSLTSVLRATTKPCYNELSEIRRIVQCLKLFGYTVTGNELTTLLQRILNEDRSLTPIDAKKVLRALITEACKAQCSEMYSDVLNKMITDHNIFDFANILIQHNVYNLIVYGCNYKALWRVYSPADIETWFQTGNTAESRSDVVQFYESLSDENKAAFDKKWGVFLSMARRDGSSARDLGISMDDLRRSIYGDSIPAPLDGNSIH